jgi:hypothetical protein
MRERTSIRRQHLTRGDKTLLLLLLLLLQWVLPQHLLLLQCQPLLLVAFQHLLQHQLLLLQLLVLLLKAYLFCQNLLQLCFAEGVTVDVTVDAAA